MIKLRTGMMMTIGMTRAGTTTMRTGMTRVGTGTTMMRTGTGTTMRTEMGTTTI